MIEVEPQGYLDPPSGEDLITAVVAQALEAAILGRHGSPLPGRHDLEGESSMPFGGNCFVYSPFPRLLRCKADYLS